MKGTSIRIAGGYLVLVWISIVYELSRRIFHAGTSEFAGMISTVLTLPGSLVVFRLAHTWAGVRPGDSGVTFVLLLGLSGGINACVLYAFLCALMNPERKVK